jgi:hypothetical protein
MFVIRIIMVYILLIVLELVLPLDDNVYKDLTFKPCPNNHHEDKRILYVATCDTRGGWKEFQALKVWNATGIPLRQRGYNL